MSTRNALTHVLLIGPRDTAQALLTIASGAAALRGLGLAVTTPLDLARKAGATWGTAGYARVKAECLLKVDAVAVLPGWEDCVHTMTTTTQAEALDLPILVHEDALTA